MKHIQESSESLNIKKHDNLQFDCLSTEQTNNIKKKDETHKEETKQTQQQGKQTKTKRKEAQTAFLAFSEF